MISLVEDLLDFSRLSSDRIRLQIDMVDVTKLAKGVVTQLAVKANALGFVDAPQLKKEAERWHKFQADIERTYLRPDKSEMKWQ